MWAKSVFPSSLCCFQFFSRGMYLHLLFKDVLMTIHCATGKSLEPAENHILRFYGLSMLRKTLREGKSERLKRSICQWTQTLNQGPGLLSVGFIQLSKMWALNFTNEINFKCYKNIFRANQEWETSRARKKCLNGRGPCWWTETGSSPACHIRTPGPDTSPLMDLDLAKQALASRGTFCQNARKHTRWLSPFTLWSTVLFKSSKEQNTSLRIHPTTSMKSGLWISSVSASWQQTEFKMQNALWKSDKVKRRKKRGFLLEKGRKNYWALMWNISSCQY